MSVPHDTHSLLCSCSVQYTHCVRENAEKSWELCVKRQHNRMPFQNTSESAHGAWSQMMHSLQHSLSVMFRTFLNFELIHRTADFAFPLSSALCSFLEKTILLFCSNTSYWPVINTQSAVRFLNTKLPLLLWQTLCRKTIGLPSSYYTSNQPLYYTWDIRANRQLVWCLLSKPLWPQSFLTCLTCPYAFWFLLCRKC